MCTQYTMCEVWQPISELPSLTVGSGLSESRQLKPNVITVFAKGLDKRLRMGMALCLWYSRDTIVRTPLTTACPLSCEGSAHHRHAVKGRHHAPAFVPWPLPIMTSLSPHSWRGQGTGRRGVKDRSVAHGARAEAYSMQQQVLAANTWEVAAKLHSS